MRLLIVSNRLLVTVVKTKENLKFRTSAGGLVSGLSTYLDSLKGSSFSNSKYVWIGWPGTTIKDDKTKNALKIKALDEFNAYPVFLPEKAMENFYHGFCNKTIWPLFHYFPSYVTYDEDYWLHYKRVNKDFLNAIMEIIKPNDVVWIHDYHLMLLPKLLKEKKPNIPIGFFLHTPFPSFEIFRLLPKKWRIAILEGILGSDLVGFHTHDYTQYFLRCVLRILGYEHNMGRITLNNHFAKVDTFPMGIDFQRFCTALNTPEVKSETNELKKILTDSKTVLSIDRLDYTKGIFKRLQGYETFLEKNPQWHNKVTLILVVVPSRIGVEQFQMIKKQIDELVGKINGKFGSIHWTPILYQYKFLPFYPLIALYNISDVALITPLRDGMNLIAKEYIAIKKDKPGVLILSETAGASKELGDAIIINPNNPEEIVDALKEALEMPEDEQTKRNQIMQARLKRYDVNRWANNFIQTLLSIKKEQKAFESKLLNPKTKKQLIESFNKSKKRLFLLDYDGTLAPFTENLKTAKPSKKILKILSILSSDKKNKIVLISGRDKNTLQNWFGTLNIDIIAEHGAWIKKENKDWKVIKPLSKDWKPKIFSILEAYTDRLPCSFIEEKEFSIVWHYRKADPEQASIQTKELIDNLVNFTANRDIQILQGNRVVEVRNIGTNKSIAKLYWTSKNNFDFILAIGDDWTDEDLFKILPEKAFSIRVGIIQSHAKLNLRNQLDVVKLLNKMTKLMVN